MRRAFSVFVLVLATPFLTLRAQENPLSQMPIVQVQQLADSGDPAAQNEMGIRYRLGHDVDKDPVKAVRWFLKAARQGYAKAYFNLGTAYYNGDGVPTNDLNYCAWFIFSADASDERGKDALARTTQELSTKQMNRCEVIAATAYLTGKLIKQDYANAMRWYLAAANKGDGAACEKLAYMYDRGLGVSIDKAETIKWLQKGADLNYGPAAYELAMLYESGKNVTPDLVSARRLYEQASYLSVTQAFTALGRFYEEGLGVRVDRDKALAYYLVAASNGDATAKEKADQLSAQMSPKQIVAAKQNAAKLAGFTRSPVLLMHR
jgi:TPR repeat protein